MKLFAICAPAALIAVNLCTPASLMAQAWTPPRGELDVALSYLNTYVADHVFAHGERRDGGQIYTHAALLDVTYGITDRLALRVALPFVVSKYSGDNPHQLPIDGGAYHGSFQDFDTEIRYKITSRPVVLTPFFESILPSHDYTYF